VRRSSQFFESEGKSPGIYFFVKMLPSFCSLDTIEKTVVEEFLLIRDKKINTKIVKAASLISSLATQLEKALLRIVENLNFSVCSLTTMI
jgi:hypothetical protein